MILPDILILEILENLVHVGVYVNMEEAIAEARIAFRRQIK